MVDNSPSRRYRTNGNVSANTISEIDTRAGLQAYLSPNQFEDRELYETFGWIEDPDEEDYYATYLRNPIAKAIVDTPAETTWRHNPEVKDGEEDTTTDFENAVTELDQRHNLWSYCSRIDKLAGIGEYGILVIGFADGADLDEPVNQSALSSPEDIAWFRVFPQVSITDIDTEKDSSSERWGMPTSYDIDLSDADDAGEGMFGSVTVHHERVIHVPSTELLDDEIRGTPRQEPVFNVINDIEKVFGSASEMTYRGADYGLHVDVDPEYDFDADALNDELQRYNNQLQNFIKTQGTDIDRLGGEVTDPSGLIDMLMSMVVSGAPYAPPKRMLMGAEQAELASSQDKANYFGKIGERQTQYAENHIARNILDRLRDFGVLPNPQNSIYDLHWPDLFELNDKEQADVKNTRAQTLKNFAPQGNTDLVATEDKRVEFLESGDATVLKTEDSEQPEVPDLSDETAEQQDQFNDQFELNALGEGDTVELPTGSKGVIVMEGGKGVQIDDKPVADGEVVVAYASRQGYTIIEVDELESADLDTPENADPKDLEEVEVNSLYTNAENPHESLNRSTLDKIVGNDIGFDSWPDSWEKSDTPARVIALDAWSSMGGTWRGCFREIGDRRICSAFKDTMLGTTHWR